MVRDNYELFPLDSSRRFARNIISYAIDTTYFVDDAS